MYFTTFIVRVFFLVQHEQKLVRRVVYSFDINTNRKWFEHLKHRSKNNLKTVGEHIGVNTMSRDFSFSHIPCVLHWYLD